MSSAANEDALKSENMSLFQRLVNFFGRALGVQSKITPAPKANNGVLGTSDESLKLGTFTPIEVYLKACDIIRFRVGTN